MRLREMKERFYLYDADLTSNIAKCFKNVVDQDILISTLKLLSETGFVPLKDVDDLTAYGIMDAIMV
jgi:hypothetical protein